MNITFDIDTYKTKFTGAAKQYLFFTKIYFPNSISESSIPYYVRSSGIPDRSIEEVSVPYTGLTFKMGGNTISYGDWMLSFNVDENGKILELFNTWIDYVNENKLYMKDQTLYLLDGNGTATQTITLYGAYPKSIGAVQLDYASTDIATVDITFAYQKYEFNSINSSVSNTIKSLLSSGIGNAISKGFGI